jgi:toxin ParE1/3/4
VKTHKVVFTPEALEQIAALYHYIAVAASPTIAQNYTNAIIEYCEKLQKFPQRGSLRDDVRPGLRSKNGRASAGVCLAYADHTILQDGKMNSAPRQAQARSI